MLIRLSAVLFAALVLAGCYRAATPPQVTSTTTITCPPGTQLQSDGMCRTATAAVTCPPGTVLYADGVCRSPATAAVTCPPGTVLYADGVCRSPATTAVAC